jgi:tRNA 2-selenouridine synthase
MGAGRGDTEDFRRLFLADAPLLDTRAPLEFARGAFPTATNIPLMSDEERAAVGTCYKQHGQAAAIALGHELVGGATREQRLARWCDFARRHPDGYLYCWRGGLRSQTVQDWLREAGIPYPRVVGGYKALRRFLIDTLDTCAAQLRLVLVAGATGSGKTRVIRALPRAPDLEGLARHRGSAFGRLLEPQPTQIDFENALAIALLKLAEDPGPVFLEDEGRLVGRVALPETLRQAMSHAPLLVVEEPFEARVQVLLEDYVIDLGARFDAEHADRGVALHRERLLGDLARIRKRLGGERTQQVAQLMDAAFDAQARGAGIDAHREWIRVLLRDYYDPMYEYQMAQRGGERLFRGPREALIAVAREMAGDAN